MQKEEKTSKKEGFLHKNLVNKPKDLEIWVEKEVESPEILKKTKKIPIFLDFFAKTRKDLLLREKSSFFSENKPKNGENDGLLSKSWQIKQKLKKNLLYQPKM